MGLLQSLFAAKGGNEGGNDAEGCHQHINSNVRVSPFANCSDVCSEGLRGRSSIASMDVTRHNFVDTLSELRQVVDDCEFVAIDTELSGLRRECKPLSLLDLQHERYAKIKESIAGYQIIQFGLSCFKRSQQNNGYDCHSYNFYIFPQKSSSLKTSSDRTFCVQSSSLTFLSNNGFDFNKLIRDGISYLNRYEQNKCIETLKEQNDLKSTANANTSSSLSEDDHKFVADVVERVNSFIGDRNVYTLDLAPCNAFRRKLVYETLKSQQYIENIDIKTLVVSQNSSDRYLSISKIDKFEKVKQQEEMLTEAIGFSKVIQLLIEKQKPVVGHNVMLDLMHTFNQFIEPLPESYDEFKQSIHELFPILYDTKHISSAHRFKDLLESTALGDLFERLKKRPFKPIDVNLVNNTNREGAPEKSMHEAGYDSYLTGVCFLYLTHYFGALVKPQILHYDSCLVSDFKNKLYLTYSLDIRYLNLDGEELVSDRSHVFHVTFPKEWKTSELIHLFSTFGGITIIWINETSAYCALKEPSNASKIKKSLIKQSSNTYKVMTYHDFINRKPVLKRVSKIIAREPKKKMKAIKLDHKTAGNCVPEKTASVEILNNSSNKLFEESQEWDSGTE